MNAGTFGYVAPSLTASVADSRYSVSAGYAQRRADPYEDGEGVRFTERANYRTAAFGETAFHVDTLWAGGTLKLAPAHRLRLRMTRQEGDRQLYPYLLMDAEYDDASRVAAAYDALVPFGRLESVEASVSYGSVDHFMTDALRVSSQGFPRPYSMATLADSAVWDERVEFRLRGGVTAGVDAYQRNWNATTRLAGPTADYRPQGSIPDVDAKAAGLFASWEAGFAGAWKLQMGARLDRASTRADESLANGDLYYAYHGTRSTSASDSFPSGSVSASYSASSALEWFAGVGRTVRIPSALERYYALKRSAATGSDWVGNPGLVPAKNTEIDAGVRLTAGAFSLDAAAYRASLDDFIVVVDAPRRNEVPGVTNTKARSYENNDARMWGAELTAHATIRGALAIATGISYVRGEQDIDPALGIQDRDLPEMAPLNFRVAARYDRGKWFTEAEVGASARQDKVNADLLETRTPGFGVVDLRGGLLLGRLSVFARVSNLFDRFYREHESYQRDPFRSGALVFEPGRRFALSVQARY